MIITAIACAVFAIAIYVVVHLTIDRVNQPAPSPPVTIDCAHSPSCV